MGRKPTWDHGSAAAPVDSRIRYRLTSLSALRSLMLAQGITSGNQLAIRSGVKVGTINHLVHGRRTTASSDTVRKIREALGHDARGLFVLEKSTVHGDRAREVVA